MMRLSFAALLLLLAATMLLWRRVRRIERRLEQLQDRATDWRLHLGRRQEEMAEALAALGGGRARPGGAGSSSASSGSGTGAAAPGSLIQIRRPGGDAPQG